MIWAKRRGYFCGVGRSFFDTTSVTFHRKKASAHRDKGQAKLGKNAQPGDRAGDYKIIAFPHLRRGFLRAQMKTGHVIEIQRRTNLLLELYALLGAVQKGEGEIGAEKLQHQPGEARTAADVQNPLSGKRYLRQDRRTVQHVEPRDIRFTADGGEVHLLAALREQGIEKAEASQGVVRIGKGKRGESFRQDCFELIGHGDLRQCGFQME